MGLQGMYMQMNNKGFVFLETVIVTVVIFTFSIPMYILTKNAVNSFELKHSYDKTEHLYDLNSLKVYLYRNYDVNSLCDYINDNSGLINKHKEPILPLYQSHSTGQFNLVQFENEEDTKLFESLLHDMGIKKLFFTDFTIDLNDNNGAKKTIEKINSDDNLREYLEYISKDNSAKYINKDSGEAENIQYLYRLVAEFDDGTFASINMYRLGRS